MTQAKPRTSYANDAYVITMSTKNATQVYGKDKAGWFKRVLSTGRVHRMTPEQLLNHLLPALVGDLPLAVTVKRKKARA